MSAERNKVILYRDWQHLLSEFGSTNTTNAKIRDTLKAEEKKRPFGSTYNKGVNACAFILRRESILIHRGKSTDASHQSPVSSVGYVAMVPSVAAKFAQYKGVYGGIELDLLWATAGPWAKGHLACIEILYKDSKLSGIIARRAIDDNHFNDKALARDAKWRMENSAPANPSMISGSSDVYEPLSTKKYVSEDIKGPKMINFL